jgi:diaminopimelate epimerase
MTMKFTKMHGAGNDFVVIDAVNQTLTGDLEALSRKLADRHFGIGCDQVLVVCPSDIADFKMLIFNNDGGEVEMCGNGIRCLARFVYETGMTDKTSIEVETLAGIIKPEIVGDQVRVDMGEPRFDTADWPWGKTVARDFEVDGRNLPVTLVSMGNPHCVVFQDELNDELVLGVGPKLERHASFPNRINVEFIQVLGPRELSMRVWERGTGETLACGTGACASAVAAIENGLTEKTMTIHLLGGDLQLEWADDKHVYMTGPAETVFTGEVD